MQPGESEQAAGERQADGEGKEMQDGLERSEADGQRLKRELGWVPAARGAEQPEPEANQEDVASRGPEEQGEAENRCHGDGDTLQGPDDLRRGTRRLIIAERRRPAGLCPGAADLLDVRDT